MSVLVAAGDKVGALNEIRVIFLSLPKKEWNVFCQIAKETEAETEPVKKEIQVM